VLWALQSPTLLNLLRATDAWDLRVEALGDHEGLAEADQGRCPGLAGEEPDVIFVCSPRQLESAQAIARAHGHRPRIVWVAHNGTEGGLVPRSWGGALLVMSAANVHTHAPSGRDQVFVIRPHIAPRFDGRVARVLGQRPKVEALWGMRNRPTSRDVQQRMRTEQLARCVEEADVAGIYQLYGQDTPGGYLTEEERDALFFDGIAYVSSVPTNAGFGLAEHEALALGSRLIAFAWGDARLTLAGYPGIVHSSEQMVHVLRETVAEERADHTRVREKLEAWSVCGWDLLATHYSRRTMDLGIEALLAGVL